MGRGLETDATLSAVATWPNQDPIDEDAGRVASRAILTHVS
jgi:hypothetical protein